MDDETKPLAVGVAITGTAILLSLILLGILAGCGTITTGGLYERTETPEVTTLRVTGPTTRNHDGAQTMEPVTIAPDGTVEFGGSTLTAAVRSLHGSPILLYAGIGVAVIAVILAWILGRVMIGILGAALGAGLIGLAYYPWIGGIAACVAILGCIIYVILALLDARRDRQALEEVVTSVNVAVPRDVRKNIMSNIQSKSTEDLVEKIKKARDAR